MTQAVVGQSEVRCAFCGGEGRDPFGIMSALSTCCVCGGKGLVSTPVPHVPCAFCQGTGVYPRSRLTCTACGGMGVSPVREPDGTCPHCLGRGVDPHTNAGFYCLVCHGTGVLGRLSRSRRRPRRRRSGANRVTEERADRAVRPYM